LHPRFSATFVGPGTLDDGVLCPPSTLLTHNNDYTSTKTPHPFQLPKMPSATGENWEKHTKNFADDEEPEKKITPLTDE
jgi:hypothetical protein